MSTVTDIDPAYQFEVIANSRGDWRRDAPWQRKRLYWLATYSRVCSIMGAQTVQVRLRHELFIDRYAVHHVAGQLLSAVARDEIDKEQRSRPAWRRRRR